MKNQISINSLKPFMNIDGLKANDIVERKQYTSDIKVMPDEERTIVARLSTIDVDGDSDVVIPSGADLKRFMLNPIIHKNHDYKVESVIGKAVEIGVDDFGIVAKIKFAETPAAEDVWQLVKNQFVRCNSIGFVIKECVYRGTKEFNDFVSKSVVKIADTCTRIITKYELLESSVVSVPSNPTALIQAISLKSIHLSDKTIAELDLPKVIVVDKGIEVISTPEIPEIPEIPEVVAEIAPVIAPEIPEIPEVPIVEAQAVVPVAVEAVDNVEAPIIADPVVDVAPVVEPVEPARSISVVSAPSSEPKRSITLIRSLKVVRKGDVDAKGEARRIILAKKGKVI